MAKESKFQSKVVNWLRSKGCYVTVTDGRPMGVPDVVALCDGGAWITLETKASNPYRKDGVAKKGAFKPLQLPTIAKLDAMYYSKVTWPENWEKIQKELMAII